MTTWNDKFELTDGSYSVSDIQDYFEYIIKKHKTLTDNSLVRIYVKKNREYSYIKIKAGYYLEILMPGAMKLLGNTKNKIAKDENEENVAHLEITEAVLVLCNFVNNYYQHDSRFLYTFVPNKSFGQLLDISPKNVVFLETFNLELSYIELWCTAQNFKRLEIKITLIIN